MNFEVMPLQLRVGVTFIKIHEFWIAHGPKSAKRVFGRIQGCDVYVCSDTNVFIRNNMFKAFMLHGISISFCDTYTEVMFKSKDTLF